MNDETAETVRRLLRSVLETTDDAEVHYKLRTALQLLDIHRNEVNRLKDAAERDEDLHERLRELGYLE
ncbi:MAG: hypothetical protein ABEK02_05450 [Haloquadratum sp.]